MHEAKTRPRGPQTRPAVLARLFCFVSSCAHEHSCVRPASPVSRPTPPSTTDVASTRPASTLAPSSSSTAYTKTTPPCMHWVAAGLFFPFCRFLSLAWRSVHHHHVGSGIALLTWRLDHGNGNTEVTIPSCGVLGVPFWAFCLLRSFRLVSLLSLWINTRAAPALRSLFPYFFLSSLALVALHSRVS